MTRTANYIRATIVLTMGLLTAYNLAVFVGRIKELKQMTREQKQTRRNGAKRKQFERMPV